MEIFNTITSTSTQLLIAEAACRGITAEHVNSYLGHSTFVELKYKNHREFIFGQNASTNSLSSKRVVDDKVLTKIYLKRAGLNVSEGDVFRRDNRNSIIPYCEKIGFPVVLKPIDGTHGTDVHVNLRNSTEVQIALNDIYERSNTLLVEKMFRGEDYRILATRTKVLGVIKRVPANVIGDGTHTIKELIALKNKERSEFIAKKTLEPIIIDTDLFNILGTKNLTIESIPAQGITIYLRKKSNLYLSEGGDSVDVTDAIHPNIAKIAVRAIRAVDGLSYAGIDFITNQNLSEKPTKNSHSIVEMNGSPMLSLHRFPYKGTARHIERDILDLMFPETRTAQPKKKFFALFKKSNQT